MAEVYMEELQFPNGTVYTIRDKKSKIYDLVTLPTSGSINLTDNSVNKVTPASSITFKLPSVTDSTIFHQILVQVNLTTVVSINVGTTYYFNKVAPDLSTVGVYDLIWEYDSNKGYWVCGCLSKGVNT